MDVNGIQPDFLSPWYIINDNVMGGKSIGVISENNDIITFSGVISLENNGGFSSTLVAIKKLEESISSLAIDMQGDGHRYQVRAVVNKHGYRLAYKHEFDTSANQRESLLFLLKDFKASFRGRDINDAPELRAEDIDELGILISSKRDGEFALIIHNLSMF